MNEEELLSCPFCGEKPELFNHYRDGNALCESFIEFVIECPECQSCSGYSLDKNIVIKSWNTRIK